MKRVLVSILCSAGMVFGYFLSLVILYRFSVISFDALALLLIPLNVPYNLYKSLFGLYYGSPETVKFLNLAALILLCAVPFYLVFSLYAKIKNNSQNQHTDEPPEPPQF